MSLNRRRDFSKCGMFIQWRCYSDLKDWIDDVYITTGEEFSQYLYRYRYRYYVYPVTVDFQEEIWLSQDLWFINKIIQFESDIPGSKSNIKFRKQWRNEHKRTITKMNVKTNLSLKWRCQICSNMKGLETWHTRIPQQKEL